MWEFRNRNVFGATAFATYGGFWIGLGLWVLLVAEAARRARWPRGVRGGAAKDLGWILLAFAIFNTYMLLWSTQVNAAVFAVFLTLEATEIILFIGNFSNSSRHRQVRRLDRRADRAGGLVHLGGRGAQRHGGRLACRSAGRSARTAAAADAAVTA